ncbi:MAG: endonuclease [Bacteroidota bacterium]
MVAILCVLMAGDTTAQIHEELTGDELYSEVVATYKPNFVEVYTQARVLMYTEIYNVDNYVQTLYSGHELFLPPDEPLPIQFLAQDGRANGINAEHIYPRSKGARPEYGNAFSDLHNLAPTRWAVNEARSNFPFAEVEDRNATGWFLDNVQMLSDRDIPSEDKDLYSEVFDRGGPDGLFEPRETVKGDVARSAFYFFTMYREEAEREDPDYFEQMRAQLCDWHNADPVDTIEMQRNLMKAMVQDGKPNPFVMDCSLANRMYCPDASAFACQDITTSIGDELIEGKEIEPLIQIYPNPNNGIFTLDITEISPGGYIVDIYQASGKLLYSLREDLDYYNSINLWNVKSGMHIIHITDRDTGRKYSGTFQVIK